MRLVGDLLDGIHDDAAVSVLHERRLPGTTDPIRHVAVTPSGVVWIVEARSYAGAVQRIDHGGWFRHDYRLYVGKWECTALVAELEQRRAAVADVIREAEVRIALCLPGGEWALAPAPFALAGVWIGPPELLLHDVCAPGTLDAEELQALVGLVAAALPSA